MTLKFYYRAKDLPHGPLVASACIPGNGAEGPPWPAGRIEFEQFDIRDYVSTDHERWVALDARFRRRLPEKLKEFTAQVGRPALPPWSRSAFEHFVRYGINASGFLVRCELYEDDGTPWRVK
jgi:hypothetical protein